MIESLVLLFLKRSKGENKGIAYIPFEISYMGCCKFTPLVSMTAGEKEYELYFVIQVTPVYVSLKMPICHRNYNQ